MKDMEHPYGPLLEHFDPERTPYKIVQHQRGPLLVFNARTLEEKEALWNQVKRVRDRRQQEEEHPKAPGPKPTAPTFFQRLFGIGTAKQPTPSEPQTRPETAELKDKPKTAEEQLRRELEALAKSIYPPATHYANVTVGMLNSGTVTVEVARKLNGP